MRAARLATERADSPAALPRASTHQGSSEGSAMSKFEIAKQDPITIERVDRYVRITASVEIGCGERGDQVIEVSLENIPRFVDAIQRATSRGQ